MAAKCKPMSTIKQILRLHYQGKKIKFIARHCRVSKNTVKRYLNLILSLGYNIGDILEMEETVLAALFTTTEKQPDADRYEHLMGLMPYFEEELQKTGVTRTILWKEYLAKNPSGYGFTQFCVHLQNHKKSKSSSMVLAYQPGEVLFVDYAGKTLSYFDKSTGEESKCQIFVATLGYSQYAYIQAFASQKVEDFVDALNKCVGYFGGVPKAIVTDNLKSAVIKSDRYEPTLNRILEDWANHHQTTILPARAIKPKDKALVEGTVKIAYSRVFAPLRNQVFTSILDLNQAITVQNAVHNVTNFQRKGFSRNDLFNKDEKTTLLPLPSEVFKIKKYRTLTVQKNCYVFLGEDNHYYSVPLRYIGQKVEVVYSINTVSIYYKSTLVAQHIRTFKKYGYTTISEHLPSHYNAYKDRSPEYYRKKAAEFADELLTIFNLIFLKKQHPELSYRSCDGLLSLARKTDEKTFANACKIALLGNRYSYKYILEIITNGAAEHFEDSLETILVKTPPHENIRGKEFFNQINNNKNESRTANV